MGYASWINLHDSEPAEERDEQWLEPLILQFNGQERKVFIIVDMETPRYWSEIAEPTKYEALDFTEQEIALPLRSCRCERLPDNPYLRGPVIDELEEYYLDYRLAKSGVDFNFNKEELST